MDCHLGRMVLSLAGRDKGCVCAVVGVIDDNFVLIANGRSRKVESPKKKKVKHLKPVEGIAQEYKILPQGKVTNKLVREAVDRVSDALNEAV